MERVAGSSSAPSGYHAVRFYESDKSLVRIVADFLKEGLDGGSPAIVVATAALRTEIIRELTGRSLDVDELLRSDDLLMVDAKETLSKFMVDGHPDAGKFNDQMSQVIREVCRGRADCTVRIFGQMVDVLWQDGERDAAIRLEMLWNRLAQSEAFSLLCGYAMGNFYKDAHFADICGQHSHIVSHDGGRIASPEQHATDSDVTGREALFNATSESIDGKVARQDNASRTTPVFARAVQGR